MQCGLLHHAKRCTVTYSAVRLYHFVGCFGVVFAVFWTPLFYTIYFKGELHFIILNYAINYTLHHKLFKYTFCTIVYDLCYTLHPNVKFAVNLNGKVWHHVKWPNCPSSQPITNKEKITLYHPKLYSWLYFAP